MTLRRNRTPILSYAIQRRSLIALLSLTICIQQGVFSTFVMAADGTSGGGSNLPSENDLGLILGNPQPKADPEFNKQAPSEELQPATKTTPAGSDVLPPGVKQLPESSEVTPPGAKPFEESDAAPPVKPVPEDSDPPKKSKVKAAPKQDEETGSHATTSGESDSDSGATTDDAPSGRSKGSPTSKGRKKDGEDWGYNETSKGKKPADDAGSASEESTASEEPKTPPAKAKEDAGTGGDTGSDSLFATPFVKKKTSDTEDDGTNEDLTIMKSRKSTKRVGHIAEADELLLKHKYQQAEDAYRSLIGADQTGDAYAGLAVALARQENSKKIIEAQKIVSKGKTEFADNPNMVAAAGYVAFMHSKSVASPAKRDLYLEAADKLCKRAINEDPNIVIAHQTLGMVYLAQDDPEGAIKPLKNAVNLLEDPENLTLLAEAYLKKNPKDKRGGQLADMALDADAYYHAARLQKAIFMTASGKHEEAHTELHTIPIVDRGSAWQETQGDIYRKQGDGPSALGAWKEANRLDPRNPGPYRKLAEYYAIRGDGAFAIAEMHNALEILPNDLNLRQALAELALRQDNLEVAEQEFRTILNVKPDDPKALLGLSRAFFRKARKEGQYPPGYNQLMEQLQNVINEHSVHVTGEMQEGVRDLKENISLSEAEKSLTQNRFREARDHFRTVIDQHREDPFELLTLGEQAFNDGDLRSAELSFTYAKEIPEVATRADQGISRVAEQRKKAQRFVERGEAQWKTTAIAMDEFKQALIADPQSARAYLGLYKLHMRVKEYEKALEYAKGFLEAADDNNPARRQVEDDISKLKAEIRRKKSK